MSEQSYTPAKYFDAVSEFTGGMNSGVAPTLLQKNQLAFALNASLRGGYISHRPPFNRQQSISYPSSQIESFIATGLFQGAGYYKPDIGSECLIVQISGRLFQYQLFTNQWVVTEISIPNDLNDATVKQVWMWQAEKWMIIRDGTSKLPIFYDGTASRRSFGPSVTVGQVSGVPNPSNPPAIGGQVSVVLDAPYTGNFGVPVIFNGEYYQIGPGLTGFYATLQDFLQNPQQTFPIGTPVTTAGSLIGFVTATTGWRLLGNSFYLNTLTVAPNQPVPFPYAQIYIGGKALGLYSSTETQITVAISTQSSPPSITAGQAIYSSNSSIPTQLGTVSEQFSTPQNGASVLITMDQLFSGKNNTFVQILGNYFLLSPASSPTSTSVSLLNLSDVKTASYASNLTIESVPEIPAGRQGAYGMGCNCVTSLDGISFLVGDVVGSSSGTPANDYRDAVLKTTQNDFLLGGGSFRLPSSGNIITAVTFPPILDTSLGQGALQIGTAINFFSNSTPGTDPSTWPSLTTPIQTVSLKGFGPLAQNSTIQVNSDTIFRSQVGIGSLVLARREFANDSSGNKTISNEVIRILQMDNTSLLQYGSGQFFDNRMSMTVAPASTNGGIVHRGLVSLNYDLLSSMRQNFPATWEGLWTGVNVLQIVTGQSGAPTSFNGEIRSFAFTYNANTSQIELYEILGGGTTQVQDNGDTPIVWAFETGALFNGDVKPMGTLGQLRDGELYVSDLVGEVTIQVYYRPDFYPGWQLWNTVNLTQASDASNSQSGYRMRVGLGEPSSAPVETGNNRPLRQGYFFQFRVVVTGTCKIKAMRFAAISVPTPTFAPVKDDNTTQIIDLNVPDDLTLYSLQGIV